MKKEISIHWQISSWNYIVLLLAYSWISLQLFIFTSGGWSVLFYGIIVKYFYISIFVIFSAILLIRRQKVISVDKRLLIFLFSIQIAYLMLNFGDCGDNPGRYTFVESQLSGGTNMFCNHKNSSQIAIYSMVIMPIAYSISFLLLIIKSLLSKKLKP
jgi:hypothetical protein